MRKALFCLAILGLDTSVRADLLPAPLPCALRGAIWYQGESNAGKPAEYRALFPGIAEAVPANHQSRHRSLK